MNTQSSSANPSRSADLAGDPAAELIARLARPEIRALRAYSSARSLAPGSGVLLNANENPWPPPGDDGLALNRYPDPQPQQLRERLAQLYGLAEEQLLLTRGSDEGIDLLLRAFCRAGLDRIAITPPCFGMYEVAARIQGAEIETYPLAARSGFLPDFTALSQTQAKLVFLCSPNNPTGNSLPREAVLQLAEQLAERAFVVVDEAYIEFSQEASIAAQLPTHPNLVVLRTLSKAWALAGVRLGIVAAAPALIALLRKILAPYPLPKTSVAQCLQALVPTNQRRVQLQLDLIRSERERISQFLACHPQVREVFPSAANFILLQVDDADAWLRATLRSGIVLRDQSSQLGLAQCLRISIGSPAENDALLSVLERLK